MAPTPAKVAREARSAVRRFGFRPLLLGATFGERVAEHVRLRRLRPRYQERIVDAGPETTLRVPRPDLGVVDDLPAELHDAAERIRGEAEAVLRHEVAYLGSGPVALGPRIDWHQDFKSGYRWPADFYLDVEVTRLDDDSDAKVPWELSRGHQLLTLARAARLFEDERFASELEAQLDDWMRANPPGYGINWVNPMEIAIRAVNWAWAIGTLEGWRPLEPGVRARVTRSLQAHARHIAANLEGSPLVRSNHYLSDLLGLLALGAFLPGDPAAAGWLRYARRRFEREITTQVLADGVCFEASLPYHGLVLEIYLLAWYLAGFAGRPLSMRYRRRVEQMLEVSRAVRHPDGRLPVFGDQDSGRVLPAGFSRPCTQDQLLDLGAAVLDQPRWRPAPPDEEVAWNLGLGAWRALAARPVRERPIVSAFPEGGLYVLDGGGTHLVVSWGGVGQNGNGGHAHNDLSSYELSRGVPLVVDSGTYIYTADVAARNAFRSARAHNVVVVDGLDMHPLPPGQTFQMPAHARHEVLEWRRDDRRAVLVGRHDGFRRPGSQVTVTRRFELDRTSGAVEVSDRVDGTGRHRLDSFVHLAPECEAALAGDGVVSARNGETAVTIAFEGDVAVDVEQGWVSSEYGVREPAPVVRAALETELPAQLRYRIEPA